MENIHNVIEQNTKTPNQEENSEGKKKIKIWLWILIGAVSVALLALAVLFIIVPSFSAQKVYTMPNPLLYTVDDEVFVILDENESISLGEVDMPYPGSGSYNGILCENRYLYYLVDVSRKNGEGTLMRLDLLGSKKPVEFAENICTGQFLYDHKKLLYLTNMKEGAGTLYLLNLETGKEEKIAKKVIPTPFGYGLSHNGEHIFYVCQKNHEDIYSYELYMKSKGEDSYKVNECIGENYDQFFFNINYLDSGVLIHRIISLRHEDFVNERPDNLYISQPNADTSLIASEARSYVDFENSFTYDIDNEMFYVDEEGEENRISNKYGFSWNVYDIDGEHMQDRFLLGETDGSDDEVFTMYEQFLDGNRLEIGQTDSHFPTVNKRFTFVAFEKDESLYVSTKEEDSWIKPYRIGRNVKFYKLNNDETALYYIVRDNENTDIGTIYRYDLATEKKQKLQEEVETFRLYGDMVYSIYEDELYWVKSEDEHVEIIDDIYITYEGLNGVYITTETSNYDIYYLTYGDTEPVLLYEDVDACSTVLGFLEYSMPVPTEAKDGLEVLYHDSMLLIDLFDEVETSETMWMHYTESIELADYYRDRPDIDRKLRSVFSSFYYGYSYLAKWLEYEGDDYSTSSDYLEKCEEYLSKAIEDYEIYKNNSPNL